MTDNDSRPMAGLLNAYGRIGWWHTGLDGRSLQPAPTGMVWGDAPADAMDVALGEIAAVFEAEWGRLPTLDELIAGVRFSAMSDRCTEPMPWCRS